MTLLQLETPFEAESPTKVTVRGPPKLTGEVAEPMCGGGTCAKHWTRTAAGQVMDVVLVRVMVWTQVAELPCESVAVQVRVMIGPAQFEPLVVSVKVRV